MNRIDDTTRNLLAVLHRGGAYSYWWTLEDLQSYWWQVDNPAPLPNGQINIYFGVHPGNKAKGKSERTTIADVMALNCFYGEFDVFNAARKERKPTHFDSKEAALAYIQTLPFRPSILVDSGGGYYGFWLLHDTFLIQSEDDRTRARVAQRAWVNLVGSDDDAKDLARILRVPGTCNLKPEYGPDFPKVLILGDTDLDRRYTFDELEQAALAKQQQRATPRALRPFTPTTPALEVVADALRYIPIHQDYEDWVRVLMAVRSEYPGADGVAICEAWSPGYSGEIETKFKSFSDSGNASGKVTIGTLYYLAKAHGWQPSATAQAERRNGHPPSEPGAPPVDGTTEPPIAESSEAGNSADNQPATWPYAVRDGQMVYLYRAKDEDGNWQIRKTPVTTFTACITEEITGESGTKHFTVHGTAAHDFHFEIEAGEFSQTRLLKSAITQAGGASATVLAKQSEHLVPAIMRLSLPDQVKQIHRYDRVGWADGKFLIPGREPEGVALHLPRKLPYGLPADADLGTGLMALEALAAALPPTATTPVLAMIFQAALAYLAKWRNERYGFFVGGRTGSLKTSWAQVAMALYGPDFMRDDLIIKWGEGSTRNAIMALATRAHDTPFLIDNYKPSTGDGARGFTNLIHNLLEGGEKERLTRAAELRDSRAVFCWPIFTGEDVPDNDPASLARILTVQFPWQGGQANERLTIAQEAAYHLSAVGRSWLDWLESEAGQDVTRKVAAQFVSKRAEWGRYLATFRSDSVNILRIATNLATNQLTWWAVGQHPQIGPIAHQHDEDHRAGLAEIAQHMCEQTATSLEAQRYLSALRELLGSRYILLPLGVEFGDRQNVAWESGGETHSIDRARVLGWHDGAGGAYILPTLARAAIEQVLGREALGSISDRTLYSQLEQLKFIASKDKDGNLKVIRVVSKTYRVLHLTALATGDVTEKA